MNKLKEVLKEGYFRRVEKIKPYVSLIDENHLENGLIHHIQYIDRHIKTGFKFKPRRSHYSVSKHPDQLSILFDTISYDHPIKDINISIFIDRACTMIWFDYIIEGRTELDEFRYKGGSKLELNSGMSKRSVKEFLVRNLEKIAGEYREIMANRNSL